MLSKILNETNFISKLMVYLRLMRLHQQTGIWLLLWPCWWSISLASTNTIPNIYLLTIFLLGAIAMRGAGCIINDIIDKDIDAKVERTKNRPIASGELSVKKAVFLLIILLCIGFFVMLQLNKTAIIISLVAFIMAIIYPTMKRLIAWPQFFLAITFNLGALIGWSTVKDGDIGMPAIFLYIAGIFWTLGYDTIYAHQDKKDDVVIGVKSTAVSMQDNTKRYVSIFYILMIAFISFAGVEVFAENSLIFYFFITLALFQLFWQVIKVNLDEPKDCMNKFKSNMFLGSIIFVGIILQKVYM